MTEETAEERIAAVQAQAPDVGSGERLATVSRWSSMAAGLAISAKGGWIGVAAYGAGVGSGYAGAWLAETIHLGDGIAFILDHVGMDRIGQGGPHPATVGHQVAHSYAFAGFLAAVAVGVVAAAVVGATLATGGAALAVIGAAAAGGFAAGFLGGGLSDALSQMGYQTGPIITGSPDVSIAGKPAARMTDLAACSEEGEPTPLVEGSEHIYINGLPMARIGHKLICGATIDEGVESVLIDDTVIACAIPEPEVPVWARIAVDWMGFLPLGRFTAKLGRQSITMVKLKDLKYSQKTASGKMRDGTSLKQVIENMRKNGWDQSKPKPDMVKWKDGTITTLDHRRIVAAKAAGLKEVPANVHKPSDPIPPNRRQYYQYKKTFTGPDGKVYKRGDYPTTWGEAVMGRSANQGKTFPLEGSTTTPTTPRVKSEDGE
ncbi:MAG: PAAR domain-containing protein [Gemmatimonadales bacterium]|nr:PAAR domain-containing protein [Gemmatimonadales bacterium]